MMSLQAFPLPSHPLHIRRYRSNAVLIALLWLIYSTVIYGGQLAKEEQKDSPIKHSRGGENILEMVREARQAYKAMGNCPHTDSLCHQALKAAELSYDDHRILETYNTFLECADLRHCNQVARTVIEKALRICETYEINELHWRTIYNISSYYRATYDAGNALAYAYKAFTLAELIEGSEPKIFSYLAIGEGLEANNERLEAFRNYLNAMNMALISQEPELLMECYKKLSFFFNVNKMYAKALEYKLKEAEILKQGLLDDSTALYRIYYELEEIAYHSRNSMNEEALQRVLNYAIKRSVEPLREAAMKLFRSHYISRLDLKGLRTLYTERYPGALNDLYSKDQEMYQRVKAYLFEYEGKPDSAIACFRKAWDLVAGDPNVLYKANFHIRFAEMLVRFGRYDLLPEQLELALARSEDGNYLPFALTAVNLLEIYAEKTHNYPLALEYSRRGRALSDSLATLARIEDLFILEIENAARMAEAEKERADREEKRMRNIQYTAITIALVLVFFIVITLGSLAIRPWVKRLMSFLSFVMLFEFFILILDHQIHQLTMGEPWKVLSFKIIIIALLLPLHHWLEHRLTNYLISRKLRIHLPEIPYVRRKKKNVIPLQMEDEGAA